MQGEYNLNPKGKPLIVDLETLADLTSAGSIHAGTQIRDTVSGRTFSVSDHPYLSKRLKPVAPPTDTSKAPPPMPPESPATVASTAVNTDPDTTPPDDRKHIFNELTQQYRTLIWWQIIGMSVLLLGPLLLLFMSVTGQPYRFQDASTLAAVLTTTLPLFGLCGLVYALFKKPAMRQTIARMQVDTLKWARPLEKPIRFFWATTGVLTTITVIACLVAYYNAPVKQRPLYSNGTPPARQTASSLAPGTLYQ